MPANAPPPRTIAGIAICRCADPLLVLASGWIDDGPETVSVRTNEAKRVQMEQSPGDGPGREAMLLRERARANLRAAS